MALIDIDVSKRPGTIEIGVQGENEAEGVAFDVTPWVNEYGLGTAYIYNQRKTDAAPYFKELPITSSDGIYTATWIYDDADTAIAGEGTCQLIYVKGDVTKKTPKHVTMTEKSLGEASGDTPDPYEDLLAAARAIYQLMVGQREATEQAAVNAHQSELAAEASAEDAAASAEEAATSATIAGNTFQIAGDVSFPVDPNTGAVYAVFSEEES